MKVSKQTMNTGEKIQSLIKEDSNEEKESSSNSNSNCEVDIKCNKIKKSELFSNKLKLILNGKMR